jgi:hypothetical protein
MLAIIVISGTQDTVAGLTLAVIWPWVAAFLAGARLTAGTARDEVIRSRRESATARFEIAPVVEGVKRPEALSHLPGNAQRRLSPERYAGIRREIGGGRSYTAHFSA